MIDYEGWLICSMEIFIAGVPCLIIDVTVKLHGKCIGINETS